MERTLQRLGEVLRIRGYSPMTVKSYVWNARSFLTFSPDPVSQVGEETVHQYLVHLKDRDLAGSTINQAQCAIRFLFTEVLHRPWELERFRCHRLGKKLPVAPTRNEVYDLFAKIQNFKHRTILMTIYSAGLRLGEATHLRVADIDSETMRILIRSGKGQKGRYVMLSKMLLGNLRDYYVVYRPNRKGWLFPGKDPRRPISNSSVQRVLARARRAAGIEKRITPHSLRHGFAVHLLESGTNLKYIKELLGHSSIQTTMKYLRLAPESAEAVRSPLDLLPELPPVLV